MKKLAVLTILLAMTGSALWAHESEGKNEQAYVLLGKHCFNREFNERQYEELISRGEKPQFAEVKASGDYVNSDDFCKRFRAIVEMMNQKSH